MLFDDMSGFISHQTLFYLISFVYIGLHLPHLLINKYFMEDSSVNFWTRFYFQFFLWFFKVLQCKTLKNGKNLAKDKENLVQKLMDLQVNSAILISSAFVFRDSSPSIAKVLTKQICWLTTESFIMWQMSFIPWSIVIFPLF